MSEKKSIPPWVWVGCGCLGAIGAFAFIVLGLGFWGAQQVREVNETMSDPDARNEKALDILGAQALPDGYFAVAAVSIPFVMEFAVLTDRPPDESGRPTSLGTKGFTFMSFPAIGAGDEELYDFFEGRTETTDSLRRERFNVELRERLAHGRLERADDSVLWVGHRGVVQSDHVDSPPDGLVSLALFECGDDRRRIGIWTGPDPTPESSPNDVDRVGTVTDEAEIERLLAPLSPCP